MNRCLVRRTWLVVHLVALLVLQSMLAVAAVSDTQVEEVLAAWKARRQTCTTLRIVVRGTQNYPRASLNADLDMPQNYRGDFPDRDMTFPVHTVLYIDLAKNLYRRESDRKMALFGEQPRFVDLRYIQASDGNLIWVDRLDRDNSGANPQVTLAPPGDEFWGGVERNWWPVFFSLGVVVDSKIDVRNLQPPLPQLLLARELQMEGRRCCLLRTVATMGTVASGHAEYVVDTTRGHIVLRFTRFTNDRPTYQADLRYQPVQDTWRISGWSDTTWTVSKDGEPIPEYSSEITVAEWDANVQLPSELFCYRPQPGKVVLDEIAQQYYRLNEDGSKTLLDRTTGQPIRESNRRWAIVVVGCIAIAVVAAVLFQWRRR